jgi:single-strand DNA-binding protein
MASVNKWLGIGNLGRDPEIRYSADGAAVCNISIACTSSWKDKKVVYLLQHLRYEGLEVLG